MAGGFLRRSMNYLGLTEDEYDEDEVLAPEEHLDPPLTSPAEDDRISILPTMQVQAISPAARERGSTVSMAAPRKTRATPTVLSPHVHAIEPAEFGDARQIADCVMAGQPVIVNLQTASRELERRMIDFCSGVTYSLGGGMERIASDLFLITPSDVELSADERQRA